MNRDILFRGKRTDFGEWVEGSLIAFSDGDMFICCADTAPDVLNKYAVDPTTVGQYTGLTDKNGVKIFEGDIVRYIDPDTQEYDIGEKYVAGWDEEEACVLFELFVYGESISYDVFNQKQAKNLEVIGNIHDNPELLKEV